MVRNAVVNAIEVVSAGADPPAPQGSDVYRGDGLRHRKTVGGSTRTLPRVRQSHQGSYACDAFGAVRANSGAASTEYHFTREEDDSTVGLAYLRARCYGPSTGRFLSRDPQPLR